MIIFNCVSQDSDATYPLGVPKACLGTVQVHQDQPEYSWINFHCLKKGAQTRKVVGTVEDIVALVNS